MRPAADAMNQVLETARNGPVAGTTPLGVDAARQAGCQIPHRLHLVRIERHYGDRTGIGLEHLRHPARQPRVTVEMALEFDEKRDAPADQVEEIAQGHHPVRGLSEGDEFEMGGRHGVQAAFSVGNPTERRVMIDHRLAVGSDVQVDFDRVVGVNGGRHGRRRVLDDAARLVVQAAMRDRPRDQPVEPGHNELLCGRATLLPSCHFERALNLDSGIEREHGDADRGTGVASLVGKGGDHEVGGSVHDFGSVKEIGRGIDEAAEPDHAHQFVEIAERGLDLSEEIDGTGARRPLAVLDRHAGAELALGDQLSLNVETELAGYDEQVSGAHEADVVGNRRGRRRQNNAKIGELAFHHFGHAALPVRTGDSVESGGIPHRPRSILFSDPNRRQVLDDRAAGCKRYATRSCGLRAALLCCDRMEPGDRLMTRCADPHRLAAGVAVLALIGVPLGLRPALAASADVELASHRAIYDLKLADARGRRQLTAAQGRIVYDFSGSSCEGYALQFRQVTELDNGEGKVVVSDLRSATWEEGAAKSYRFNFQNYLSEKLVDSVDGRAARQSDAIAVNLAKPDPKQFDVESTVVFPTEHIRRILVAARAGQTVLEL